jgi:hypothetical protein
MTLFTAVSALSTLVYAGFSIPLWFETRNNVQITQRTFETNTRPYVGASDISLSTKLQYVFITLHLKNFGSVPAKDVEVKRTFVINGNNVQLSFDDIHGGESPMSIFPDRIITLEHGSSKQTFFSMFEGDSLVEVDFEITYTDILGKKYYTHERAIIRGDVAPDTFVMSRRTLKYQ